MDFRYRLATAVAATAVVTATLILPADAAPTTAPRCAEDEVLMLVTREPNYDVYACAGAADDYMTSAELAEAKANAAEGSWVRIPTHRWRDS